MADPSRPLVVSVVVADGLVGSFGLGVSAEVFGYDRRDMGLPLFDFGLVAEAPGVLRTDTGIPITVEHGLERLARSDIVSITAWELFDSVPSPALLDALRSAYARGATLVSHCTGAFVLAAAGLLDGRSATTHPSYAELLKKLGVNYVRAYSVEDGKFLTMEGVSSAIDTTLRLVAKLEGEAAAKRAEMIIEYDPQPPFGAIDWGEPDGNGLGDALDEHRADLKRALSDRLDLYKKLFG
jgi:transcriptional regulator GlxA family with amidase domain